MTTSISSSLFCSPQYSTINSKQSSHSNSTFVKFRKSRISAAYATAERTEIRTIISPVSLYEVLGVEIGADTREVKSAYRRLARLLHPDVCESSSADEFMKVHSAYATLADPVKRAEYDRDLVQMRAGGLSPVTSSVGGFRSTSRRWETDQCW